METSLRKDAAGQGSVPEKNLVTKTTGAYFTDTSKHRKYPPFGKMLAERQQFKNPPFLVAVCVGAGAWESAKARNQRADSVGLTLPSGHNPHGYTWPVAGCTVVIEWNHGPSEQLIVELAKALLKAGAESVTVWPRWVDYSQSNLEWPANKELIRTYHPPRKEVSIAA